MTQLSTTKKQPTRLQTTPQRPRLNPLAGMYWSSFFLPPNNIKATGIPNHQLDSQVAHPP
jgi:hypothetical protein